MTHRRLDVTFVRVRKVENDIYQYNNHSSGYLEFPLKIKLQRLHADKFPVGNYLIRRLRKFLISFFYCWLDKFAQIGVVIPRCVETLNLELKQRTS
jgi:hypothetical protein